MSDNYDGRALSNLVSRLTHENSLLRTELAEFKRAEPLKKGELNALRDERVMLERELDEVKRGAAMWENSYWDSETSRLGLQNIIRSLQQQIAALTSEIAKLKVPQ